MPTNQAQAIWEGNLVDGSGRLQARSQAFDLPYSLKSRVEEMPATNPEELIAAAHAGCFTMMMTALLSRAGTPPTAIKTTARVKLDSAGGGFTITKIELETQGTVPGIDAATFAEIAANAKVNCPVSKALTGTTVELVRAELL